MQAPHFWWRREQSWLAKLLAPLDEQGSAWRELAEEVGLTGGSAQFFGLYVAPAGYVSNMIALYRITGGAIAFEPGLEISAAQFADPADPPPGCTPATLRRLAELSDRAPVSPWW